MTIASVAWLLAALLAGMGLLALTVGEDRQPAPAKTRPLVSGARGRPADDA
jgi:hypothetical protein